MKIKHNQFNLITVLLICVSLLSVSCGGGSGDGGGGTSPGMTATITLSVSPDSIPANGESSLAISVTLRDSTGVAVDKGTNVEFSTTLGTFPNEETSYSTSTPDESGTIHVSLIAADTEGTARVTVRSNGITQTYDVEFTIQVAGSVTVTSGSPQLLADGVSQTEISATVKDTGNHNMPDGTTVYFSTNLGTLSTNSATTTNGQATVTLTSSTLVGTATITATTASVSGDTEVTFIPGDVGVISLTGAPNNLTADGQSTSTIVATVTDVQGNPVADGQSISFSVITGTGTLSANTATTVNGVATVTYTASFTPLIERVRAQATNGTTATVDIVLIGQTIGSVTVSAGSSAIVADGSSTTTISATVKDLNGINVRDGIIVSFTTTAGTLLASSAATSNGVATVTLRSPTNLGFAEVRATAGGVNATVTVNFVPGAPFRLTVLATPAILTANGSSTSSIDVVVYDQNDNPVANGETLTFSAQFGLLNPLTATTSGGIASVTYTSPSSVPGIGYDTITVQTTNGRTDTARITLTEAEVSGITLTANPASLPADNSTTSTISATVTVGGGGSAPDGTIVSFTTDLGTFSGSATTTTAPTTNGVATADLRSGVTGIAIVQVDADGVSATIEVEFVAIAASLALTRSGAQVHTDNSDSVIITATTLDVGNAVIEGITVTFTTDGGQLSAPSGVTDSNGEVSVTFSSGTIDRGNRDVIITATASGLTPAWIPVEVRGTTVSLTADSTNLEIGGLPGQEETTLTVTVRDAGSVGIFNEDVIISSSPPNIVRINGSSVPITMTTEVDGTVQVTVTAQNTGTVTVTADATASLGLGAIGTQEFTVGAQGLVFTITIPTQSPYSAHTLPAVDYASTGPLDDVFSFNDNDPDTITRNDGGNFGTEGFDIGDEIIVTGSEFNDGNYTIDAVAAGTLTLVATDSLTDEPSAAGFIVTITTGVAVRVTAPTQANVQFATTLGVWDGGPDAVVTRPVVGNMVEAVLTSSLAGTASIMVSDADDSSTSDSLMVAFGARDGEKISLQASATVVDTDGDSVTLQATVTNADDEVVFDAGVAFSIENPTGGGEYVSPPIAYTDAFGIAEATFTSGFLSSDAQGVTVSAEILGVGIADSIQIIIGGTSGSVVIGQSTMIYSINNDTAYSLPMSVLVSDANGSPVSGAVITLNLWPTFYATGCWVPCGEDWCPGPCPFDPDLPYIFYPNEDDFWPIGDSRHRNLVLDEIPPPSEEGIWTGNPLTSSGAPPQPDGQLTPQLSAAGAVPGTVITDENGVGTFDLTYLKSSAAWIRVEVTGSTVVSGNQNQGSQQFTLPWAIVDDENLPDSPYNY